MSQGSRNASIEVIDVRLMHDLSVSHGLLVSDERYSNILVQMTCLRYQGEKLPIRRAFY
jgi:hypothetical protein